MKVYIAVKVLLNSPENVAMLRPKAEYATIRPCVIRIVTRNGTGSQEIVPNDMLMTFCTRSQENVLIDILMTLCKKITNK